jgi:RHS repeat-associated protein
MGLASGSPAAVATSYGYDAGGNSTVTGTSNTNSYQFAGRENDGTGLVAMRNRYYNPPWGRFISEDPIGLQGGTNLYAYAGNDPVTLKDPSGLIINPTAPAPSGTPPVVPISPFDPGDPAASPPTSPSSPVADSPGTSPAPDITNSSQPYQLAAGKNWDAVARQMGIDPYDFSDALHDFKEYNLLSPDDNVSINPNTGEVTFNGQKLPGTIHDFLP